MVDGLSFDEGLCSTDMEMDKDTEHENSKKNRDTDTAGNTPRVYI